MVIRSLLIGAISLTILANCAYGQIAQTEDFSDRVLFAFAQGAQNNCAITAVIKAAIASFGLEPSNGVFVSDVIREDGAHEIVMRDGNKLYVSKQDIELTATLARYVAAPSHSLDQLILDKAIVMYAAMAKRVVAMSNRSIFKSATDFSSAVKLLSDPGRDSDVQPELLGLACRQVKLDDVSHIAYVHANKFHAAFAILGDYDQEGERLKIDPVFQDRHKSWKVWYNSPKYWENFTLSSPSGPLVIADHNDPCAVVPND